MIPAELLSLIGRRHFLAEVRTETAQQALGTVEALARGGIAVFEISNAIPGASEILRHFATQTEIIVGVGGIITPSDVEAVAQSGARFVVSPIMAPDVLAACREARIACILGALTPTEIVAAQRAGAEMVKVFPVNALGGSHYLRALYRQFTNLHLMAAGGITIENLPDYLSLPVRAIALGSTLMPRALVERGDWVSIASNARRYVEYAQAWEAASAGAPTPQVAVGRPMMGDTTFVPVPSQPLAATPTYPTFSEPQAPQPMYPVMPTVAPTPTYTAPAAFPPTEPVAPAFSSPPGYVEGPPAMQTAFDPSRSTPSHPLAPSRPGQSQPGIPPSQPIPPAQSQPGMPPPPTEPPDAFKPWDSKPVTNPKGDDWLR